MAVIAGHNEDAAAAEVGCSANQIMAISGHRSLAEAEKYVRTADQRRLARAAIDTLVQAFPGTTGTSVVKPQERFDNQGE